MIIEGREWLYLFRKKYVEFFINIIVLSRFYFIFKMNKFRND